MHVFVVAILGAAASAATPPSPTAFCDELNKVLVAAEHVFESVRSGETTDVDGKPLPRASVMLFGENCVIGADGGTYFCGWKDPPSDAARAVFMNLVGCKLPLEGEIVVNEQRSFRGVAAGQALTPELPGDVTRNAIMSVRMPSGRIVWVTLGTTIITGPPADAGRVSNATLKIQLKPDK